MGVGAGEVGVADAGGDEPQRDVLELDLDLRLQADAEGLRALGELAADRVVVGGLGVVEDQRRGGELLDRGGLPGALGGGADVEDLVAHDRAHVELVVVDRQQHDAGLELAAPDALDDRRGVAADQPHRHVGMAAQERGHELVDPPGRGLAEDADRDGSASERGELADAVGGVLDRAQAAGRVLGEGAARLGGDHAASGADEEVGAERLLELADLLGDRGLGDAQGLRGGGEGAELERRAEAADLLQRQKLSLGLHQGAKATLMAARAADHGCG